MKKDRFTIKIAIVLISAISTIIYLNTFDEYLAGYVENEVFTILTPLIIFFLLMKLVGLGKFNEIESKKFFELLIQMFYEFRYVFAILILFTLSFHTFGKDASFADVLKEYYSDSTSEQVLTIYNVHDDTLYDQKNRVYSYYNSEFKVHPNNTYKITYLKNSKIIIDIDGPLNTKALKLEDVVFINEISYIDGAATLSWEPFFQDGKEAKQYRVESYVKQSNGELLRSGSQLIVEDKSTTATIKNLDKNKEYQFVVEPYISGKFSEQHKGTSEFISTK